MEDWQRLEERHVEAEELQEPGRAERPEEPTPAPSSTVSGTEGPWEEIDLGQVEELAPEQPAPAMDRKALETMIARAANTIGAFRYPEDPQARRAFELHYRALVGGVCEWVGWEEVGLMLVDGRQLPPWLRITIGAAAMAGGAFFIGPEGLQLPRRRRDLGRRGAERQENQGVRGGGEVGPGSVPLAALDALLDSASISE